MNLGTQLELMSKLVQSCNIGFQLNSIYNSIYFTALHELYHTTDSDITTEKSLEIFYNQWLKHCDKELDRELKSSIFTSLLSTYFNLLVELRSILRKNGYPVYYFSWLFDSIVRNLMVFASIEKDFDLSPFDIMSIKDKTRVLHYHKGIKNSYPDVSKDEKIKHPLLLIYAPINRFHIMDISKDRSVVQRLMFNGLDIYLLDWGYPGWEDSNLSLNDYVNYVKDAVQDIKQKTASDKVSILGYCWGGIIALIYAALNNESVQSLILMAAPVDFSKDNTILANWSKVIDSNRLVDEFGHVDGQVLDIGFLMRNPPRYAFDKYLNLFKRSNDKQFVNNFISVEKWLYDTPIIPGKLYQQIVNDCYKYNKLISNELVINENTIDLKNITAPLLTIVAENDDLVSPESTLAVREYISSKDITSLKIPGGHIGLCVSMKAHERLWPETMKWIISRAKPKSK
jgi:polyhydroxyalkanoate synthase